MSKDLIHIKIRRQKIPRSFKYLSEVETYKEKPSGIAQKIKPRTDILDKVKMGYG